jgi:endogenous inhibitor of DNA gyrase (YacG/DUF329 family)
MPGNPPAECPECGTLSVEILQIPPQDHDRGDEWLTQATCPECDQYQEWFE